MHLHTSAAFLFESVIFLINSTHCILGETVVGQEKIKISEHWRGNNGYWKETLITLGTIFWMGNIHETLTIHHFCSSTFLLEHLKCATSVPKDKALNIPGTFRK